MKKHLLYFTIITGILFSLSSCRNPKAPETKDPKSSLAQVNEDQSSIEGALRLFFDYRFNEDEGKPIVYDRVYFYKLHRDEIRKTIEIVEKDTIPGKDFILVFFRYSVGADVAHSTLYMKKLDNNWYIHTGYYSSLDEDPFDNGKGAEGRELLKKSDEWEKGDDKLWWK